MNRTLFSLAKDAKTVIVIEEILVVVGEYDGRVQARRCCIASIAAGTRECLPTQKLLSITCPAKQDQRTASLPS